MRLSTLGGRGLGAEGSERVDCHAKGQLDVEVGGFSSLSGGALAVGVVCFRA